MNTFGTCSWTQPHSQTGTNLSILTVYPPCAPVCFLCFILCPHCHSGVCSWHRSIFSAALLGTLDAGGLKERLGWGRGNDLSRQQKHCCYASGRGEDGVGEIQTAASIMRWVSSWDGGLDPAGLENRVWMRRGCLSPGTGGGSAGLQSIWKQGAANQESSRSPHPLGTLILSPKKHRRRENIFSRKVLLVSS